MTLSTSITFDSSTTGLVMKVSTMISEDYLSSALGEDGESVEAIDTTERLMETDPFDLGLFECSCILRLSF